MSLLHMVVPDNTHEYHFSIYQIGYEKCEPTHFFGPTIRDFYVLHFLVSGKGEYQVRGRTIPLKKGDCFLVIPNEPIFYRADPEDPGFQNFSELFSDPIFLNSFGTMFKIMLPKLAIGVIMPLVGPN